MNLESINIDVADELIRFEPFGLQDNLDPMLVEWIIKEGVALLSFQFKARTPDSAITTGRVEGGLPAAEFTTASAFATADRQIARIPVWIGGWEPIEIEKTADEVLIWRIKIGIQAVDLQRRKNHFRIDFTTIETLTAWIGIG